MATVALYPWLAALHAGLPWTVICYHCSMPGLLAGQRCAWMTDHCHLQLLCTVAGWGLISRGTSSIRWQPVYTLWCYRKPV
jgi:hypothetical protein